MNQTDNPVWIAIQYVCAVIVTVCLIGIIATPVFIFIVVFVLWVSIPAFIVSFISFLGSLRCNTKHKKILLALHAVNILLLSYLFFSPANRCDADIMEDHYIEYGDNMEQIYRNLYNKLTPGSSVDIEFEHGGVSIFHLSDSADNKDLNWDPSEEKIDSLLIKSGLDRSSLKWLEKELDEIDCISISMRAAPDAPVYIGFRRIGMGMYGYQIYQKPLSPEKQKEINESDASIVYSPHVVFQYAGGAIGSQNFTGKDEYLKKKGL